MHDQITDNDSAIARGKRIKTLRKMADLTIKSLSEKYNIGLSTIKYWEYGTAAGLTEKGATRIIESMREEGIQCSENWLLHGVGPHPQIIDVKYGNLTQNSSAEIEITIDDASALEQEINLFCNLYHEAIAMLILEDGMEPHYNIGSQVGGIRLFAEDLKLALGKFCIVETTDKQILCRQLNTSAEKGCFNLSCTNPHTKLLTPVLYNTKIISAAPIIRVWKKPNH